MKRDTSFDQYIQAMAVRLSGRFDTRLSDTADYKQIGHLKLLELQQLWQLRNIKGNFRAYAIKAIARAMRNEAIKSIGTVYAPRNVKKLVAKIQFLLNCGFSNSEIKNKLDISDIKWNELQIIIRDVVSWNILLEEPYCETDPYLVFDDIMSSGLTETDCVLIDAHLEGDVCSTSLNRKQRWSTRKNMRPKLIRNGYGI